MNAITEKVGGIQVFPEFSDISMGMKQYIDRLLGINPPAASEYTFTNMFIWRNLYKFEVCLMNESVCVRGVDRNNEVFYMVVARDADRYVDTVARLAGACGKDGAGIKLARVEERYIETLKRTFPSMVPELDRDNGDYVYLTSDLIALKGRKYDGKRNHIKRFKERYAAAYVDITDTCQGLTGDCIDLTERWYRGKNDLSLGPDVAATREALLHLGELGLKGSAIVIDGGVRAFSIAERLNPDTAVIHIEKYEPAYEGIPQAINQYLCEHVCGSYKYINREQDLGKEGLRRSKLSYNPAFMIDKYTVRV